MCTDSGWIPSGLQCAASSAASAEAAAGEHHCRALSSQQYPHMKSKMQWAGCSTRGSEHRNFFTSALHGSTALSIDRVT